MCIRTAGAAAMFGTFTSLFAACVAHAQTSGTFQGLGFLAQPADGSAPASAAMGVNADGSVVVGASTDTTGHTIAVIWTAAGVTPVGVLGSANGPHSVATGVSEDGQVVVGYSTNDAEFETEAFVWNSKTGIVGLGFLGISTSLPPIFPESLAFGTNSDGSVVVGQSTNSSNDLEAYRWTQASGMSGLGFINGGGAAPSSSANAVTPDGSVVVGDSTFATSIGPQTEAFRWTQATGMVGLGFISGAPNKVFSLGGNSPWSWASAVSSNGAVVVGYGSFSGSASLSQTEAFRWTQATGVVGLGFIGGGGSNPSSYATGVDEDGSIIVGQSSNATNANEAFRWTAATGMQSLAGLLTAAGVNLGNWQLTIANGISPNGQFIVGQGVDPAGHAEAFVVRYLDSTTAALNPPSPPPIAGITTAGSVQASVDQLSRARVRLLVQGGGFASEITDDLDRLDAPSQLHAVVEGGSAAGGFRGRVRFADGLTVLGGVSVGAEDYKDVTVDNELIGELAVRYMPPHFGPSRPFIEFGGIEGGAGSVDLRRDYVDGVKTAVGTGVAAYSSDALWGRVGWIWDLRSSTQLGAYAEYGEARQSIGAYAEPLSDLDPFEAVVGRGVDKIDALKLGARFGLAFASAWELDVGLAVARALDESRVLPAEVDGFGPVAPGPPGRQTWLEYRLGLSHSVGRTSSLGAFVSGVAGTSPVGSDAHAGLDFRVRF